MVLIVVATLMLLGFAFYQTIKGMFSAMIMAILAVLCSAVALNFYEPLAQAFIRQGWLGAYAESVCLLALFAVPLMILREVFDRFIRGNVVMGMWTDRIGGGAFGLVTAFVLVGMLMIVVQLLPLPATILTYKPYDASLQVQHGLTPRWAGQFVLSIGKHLSAGALSPLGRAQKFGLLHDDLLLEAFCLRNRPSGAWAGAPETAMSVTDMYRVRMPDKKKLHELKIPPAEEARLQANVRAIQQAAPKYPLLSPLRQTELYVIRVVVDETARDEVDNWWRLPATHFRLVTRKGKSFYPVGYLTFVGRYRLETAADDEGRAKIADVLVVRQWRKEGGPKGLVVDWLYVLPADQQPDYVVFRRISRDATPPIADGLPSALNRVGGRLALDVRASADRRRYGAQFEGDSAARLIWPTRMELQKDIPSDLRARVGKGDPPAIVKNVVYDHTRFRSGVLAGPASDLVTVSGRGSWAISQFEAPSRQVTDDYGRPVTRPMGVVRVECDLARGFVGDVGKELARLNPQLILDDGARQPHSGAYMTYGTGAGRQVYLYYAPTGARIGLDAGFQDALRANLKGVQKIGLVFLVPPERHRSATGVSFAADGTYDFYAADPLSCYSGRR